MLFFSIKPKESAGPLCILNYDICNKCQPVKVKMECQFPSCQSIHLDIFGGREQGEVNNLEIVFFSKYKECYG